MLANTRVNYTHLDYEFSNTFKDVTDSYRDVGLPYVTKPKAKRKILFVLDYVPTDDLKSKKLLHGTTGEVLDVLETVSKTMFLKNTYKVPEFSWLACSYNAFRTAGKSREFQQAAKEEFAERVRSIIVKYKPDTVIIFGDQATKSLLPKQVKMSDGKVCSWHGVPVRETVTHKGKTHKCDLVPNLSLNPIVTGNISAAALIGYMSKRLSYGLLGYNPYAIDSARIDAHRSVLIDTIPKFNKMLDMLREQPVVAIDTETKNLNKVTNKLLTIQFAKCLDFGYLLPIYHKDSPFTSKELEFICNRLRSFFEGQNRNKYHVYTNPLFDLNVLRTALGCRYMANSVWCILGGEFAMDVNTKFLETTTGDYYYSLGNLAVQYGYTGYLTNEFGKKHRGSIATVDLYAPGFIKYCTLDVTVPFAIHEKQIQYAEDIGHVKYKSLVMEQISDMIHGFSRMSIVGSRLDVDYLFSLQAPTSPIEEVVRNMEHSLLNTEAAKAANKIISRKQGIPEKSLFGNASNSSVLSLRKSDHKQILFFKVLKLEPVERGKSGAGKLDKAFQKKYKDVPEVGMYIELEKAKKLKNAFVKSFIKLLGTSEDLRSDHHIRPNYHYLKVITGRTSASDPNLQQVPNHSKLAKHIKRLFIAPPGYMYVKVDYRVHEVRGWGLISLDKGIANLFLAAKKLRDAYRLHPTKELADRLKSEADIHVVNAMYFFSVTLDAVLANDKELRNAVKAVIFGLIYQMSINTLAKNLGKTLQFTQNLVGNFNKRFPNGMKWIETTKAFAKKHFFYENPVGFRRHVWGLALPLSLPHAKRLHAAMLRQIVNSPIQGLGAQFMAIGNRQLDTLLFDIWTKEKRTVDIRVANSVHDSLENCVAYANILESFHLVEHALTTKVRDVMERRHGFNLVVDLEIDFDVGAALDSCKPWAGSLEELEEILYKGLTFQKTELGYDLNVLDTMEDIFVRQLSEKRAPRWLRQQAKNIGYRFDRAKYQVSKTVKKKKQKSIGR